MLDPLLDLYSDLNAVLRRLDTSASRELRQSSARLDVEASRVRVGQEMGQEPPQIPADPSRSRFAKTA